MLPTPEHVRPLGPDDVPEFMRLVALDPVVNVFAGYRAHTTRLDRRWLGGEVVGRFCNGILVSALHIGANLVPIQVGPDDFEELAHYGLRGRSRVSTIVGPAASVEGLWAHMADKWSGPREVRALQPHMEIAGSPLVEPDPAVRRTVASDIDVVYPACVAMYTEEVGVSPEWGGGGNLYRTRVMQLISKGWQFARFEDGRVVFKAEVACATPYAAQIQGVYVVPDRRGQGLATACMAAVAQTVCAEIAPIASLYVNDHNLPARRAYEKAGFVETAQFTTIMF
ncbi:MULTISPECIES: GNAT family N-acetyltransferase [unclassified Nocardioides]|uniref:GNAT family N-acetyltransferase n=1 Tax=unclassified Nocardioides TaxID=2615069 RepID=UPI0006FEF744|nr:MULTISPECIES: GNAT family N-acetyltransferase [unclassified Nocardioides]KQY63855.1 GCN5 family acetyltransferase [Nocardioides sp. Root140]KRF15868.1 GCN5 family acetyltransferase [Nocardioides sp. Soil796]